MWFPNRVSSILDRPITEARSVLGFYSPPGSFDGRQRRCCQREKRPHVGLVEVALAGRQRWNPIANRTSAAVEVMTIDRVSTTEIRSEQKHLSCTMS